MLRWLICDQRTLLAPEAARLAAARAGRAPVRRIADRICVVFGHGAQPGVVITGPEGPESTQITDTIVLDKTADPGPLVDRAPATMSS